MADISDIQAKLADLIAAAVYPNGTDHDSVAGMPVVAYPGWPLPAQLDKDIKAGRVNVSVWARGDGQNTTRYPSQWQETTAPVQTVTLTSTATTVTIGGTVSVPQVVVINGQAYAVQTTDTLASIAAGLAALIPGASSAGPVVSCPSGIKQAAVAANGVITREARRQTDTIQISIWAPSPDARVAVAKVIDAALADLRYIELPDGSSSRLIYRSTASFDRSENALIYRRDFLYQVEYATTVSQVATQVATPIVQTSVVLGT